MKLEIVSAEKNIYSDDVRGVVAPSIEGEIAILDNHAPLLTSLQPGEVRIIQDGSEDTYLYLSGGFIEVLGNHVTILADAAERDTQIDLERAEEALKRAEERVANSQSDMDLQRAVSSLRRAKIRVKIGKKRKNRLP